MSSISMQLVDWAIAHPWTTLGLSIYTLLVIWQLFTLEKPKYGPKSVVEFIGSDGAKRTVEIFQTKAAGHLLDNYAGKVLPVVVFESRASSAPKPSDKRDTVTLAKDLYQVLLQLKLVGEMKDDFPPLILVGHSFGGLVVRAFAAIHQPPNLVGMILADSTPLTLFKTYPKLSDFVTTRLPRVLKTASSLASMGFMHILSAFGISIIPAQGTMAQKLGKMQLRAIQSGSCDPSCLSAMKSEIEGIGPSLAIVEDLEAKAHAYLRDVAVSVITVEKVDKPWTDIGIEPEKWKREWHQLQRTISERNGDAALSAAGKNFMVDPDSDHSSLCTSDFVLDAISSITAAVSMKIMPSRSRSFIRSFASLPHLPNRPARTTNENGVLGRPSNNLKMGIVGLPNIGKSCLFNALTSSSVPSENYAFTTINPSESRALVPDPRFEWLTTCYKPSSQISAFLSVVDIAGLVRGAANGEGLGNDFLSNIKATDGIYHLLRSFINPGIVHVEGAIDPIRDMDIIRTELRLKDFEQIDVLLKKKTRMNDPKAPWERDMLEYLKHLLIDKDIDVRQLTWNKDEADILNRLQLLSAKPVVYLVNLTEEDAVKGESEGLTAVRQRLQDEKSDDIVIGFSGELEEYLGSLETAQEKQETLGSIAKMYGVKEARSSLSDIIWAGYKAMNLMHFFTCGEKEVRAWTIRKGLMAPQAAAVIHSDFEKNFIAAEVFRYEDIVEFGSEDKVKANGRILTKGKESVIEDGEIVHFKLRK
ncbi:hypothetical protein HDU97_005213 [Phlyctochytrium planicorne]|nr:hypothetical protein HDU97_005213 [Phlyctochytrium planicorne]